MAMAVAGKMTKPGDSGSTSIRRDWIKYSELAMAPRMDLVVALWNRNILHALENIVSYLDWASIENCSSVSRDWNAVFSGIAAMAERGAEGRRGTGDSLSAKSILAVYDFTGDAELTCLTTCGRLILAGMQDGSVRILQGRDTAVMRAHSGPVTAVAAVPESASDSSTSALLVATASTKGTIRIWRYCVGAAAEEKMLESIPSHSNFAVKHISWTTRRGNFVLISTGVDGSIAAVTWATDLPATVTHRTTAGQKWRLSSNSSCRLGKKWRQLSFKIQTHFNSGAPKTFLCLRTLSREAKEKSSQVSFVVGGFSGLYKIIMESSASSYGSEEITIRRFDSIDTCVDCDVSTDGDILAAIEVAARSVMLLCPSTMNPIWMLHTPSSSMLTSICLLGPSSMHEEDPSRIVAGCSNGRLLVWTGGGRREAPKQSEALNSLTGIAESGIMLNELRAMNGKSCLVAARGGSHLIHVGVDAICRGEKSAKSDPRASECRCGYRLGNDVASHLFLDCPLHLLARSKLEARVSAVIRGFLSMSRSDRLATLLYGDAEFEPEDSHIIQERMRRQSRICTLLIRSNGYVVIN